MVDARVHRRTEGRGASAARLDHDSDYFAICERGQKADRPKTGDHLYFEIPAGIEQIESLKTETHLFQPMNADAFEFVSSM